MCSAHHGFSKSNTFYVTSRVEALGGRHCASSRYSVTEDSSRILPRQRENEGNSNYRIQACVFRVKNNFHMS